MIFQSDRHFKLWDYSVSHMQMLLRSPRTPDIETNIDVVFWGVEFVELPTSLLGIEIIAASSGDASDLRARLKRNVEPGGLFRVVSSGNSYVVVASGFTVFQNMLDIFDSTVICFPAEDRPREDYGTILAHSGSELGQGGTGTDKGSGVFD